MDDLEKRMRTQAAKAAAKHVGVTTRFANMAISGERDSLTAQKVVQVFKEKLEQLKRAAASPIKTDSDHPP